MRATQKTVKTPYILKFCDFDLMEILTCPLDSKGPSIENNVISIEILTYPLDLKGTSIESNLISIEILTYSLDLIKRKIN